MSYIKIGPLTKGEDHQITVQHEGGEGVVHKFYSFTKDADHFRLCYPGDDPPETVWVKEYPKATSQAVQAEFQALAQAPDEPLMIDGNDLGVNDAIMTLFGEATDNPRLIRDCPHTPSHKYSDGKEDCRSLLTSSVEHYEVSTEEPADPSS